MNKQKARETMLQHLQTFFQTKYGLKQIAMEQAYLFKQSLQLYKSDIEVELFILILNNNVDEQFIRVQQHVKD